MTATPSDHIRLCRANTREVAAWIYCAMGARTGAIAVSSMIEELAMHYADVHGTPRAAALLYGLADSFVGGGEALLSSADAEIERIGGVPILMDDDDEGDDAEVVFTPAPPRPPALTRALQGAWSVARPVAPLVLALAAFWAGRESWG